MNDWTQAWTRAVALALSAPLRRPVLADPAAARLLARCLEDVVTHRELPLLAWLILPDGLHVIGSQATPVAWTAAIGSVKQSFSRRSRGTRWAASGPCWRTDVRVRPLAERDLGPAIDALHALPVREGLVPGPGDWPWSSERQAARTIVA